MAFNVNDAMPIRVKDSTSGAIGYETAVENVIANLDAETNSEAFSAAVDKLNQAYGEAKKIEEQILNLALPRAKEKTMAALNKKLDKFSQEISSFTGPALDANIVAKYRAALGSLAADAQLKIQAGFEAWLNDLVENLDKDKINRYFPNNKLNSTHLKDQLFKDFMNQWYMGGGKFRVTRGVKANKLTSRKYKDIILQVARISFKDLTITQWQRLVEKYVSPNCKVSRADTNDSSDTNTTTTVTIENNVNLYTISSKDAREKCEKNESWPDVNGRPFKDIVDEVNNQMTDLLCRYAQQNGKADDSSPSAIMKEVVTEMLDQNQYIFFFGGNPQEIVGRMGEIAANYLMRRMFPSFKEITWNAENRDTGKQAHRDLIVQLNNKFGFGLQVKNTLKEAVGSVSFESATIEHWLDVAEISGSLRENIETFYALRSFNVPYTIRVDENNQKMNFSGASNKHYKGRTHLSYKQVNDPNEAWECENKQAYITSYDKLKAAISTVEFLTYTAVAATMFLQVGSQMDANDLFLLGNQTFVSAAQILEQLIKELEAFRTDQKTNRTLKINRTTDSKASQRNIVTYMNNRDRSSRSGIRDEIMGEIILTSSFDFSQWTKQLKS